jgi:hypothetical protein
VVLDVRVGPSSLARMVLPHTDAAEVPVIHAQNPTVRPGAVRQARRG